MAKGFSIKGTVKRAKNVSTAIQAFKSDCLEHQITAVQEATFLIHETAVKSIQENSSGTSQVRYNPKRTVLASKPGDAPNTDTGRLAQSVKFDFKKNGLIGRVGTNLKYGKALEFGTKYMDPRPWLSTAVRVVSKDIQKIFAKALKQSVKGNKK